MTVEKEEEKLLFRAIAQKEHITITADINQDMTYDEARAEFTKEIFRDGASLTDVKPFYLQPINTKEKYDAGAISFCPRCGTSVRDQDLESSGYFDCFNCNTSIHVNIEVPYDDDEDEDDDE